MKQAWYARPFKYGDGVPWNDGRWIILAPDSNRKLVEVGGAMSTYNNGTIAWLCTHNTQEFIRRPEDAERESHGYFVWGQSLMQALKLLKYRYPDPHTTVAELDAELTAAF